MSTPHAAGRVSKPEWMCKMCFERVFNRSVMTAILLTSALSACDSPHSGMEESTGIDAVSTGGGSSSTGIEEQDPELVDLLTLEEPIPTGSTTVRADVVAVLTPPSNSSWGTLRETVYCNPGAYAVGYEMRVEGSQGNGDDTALNAIRLLCRSKSDFTMETVTSHEGMWGEWRGFAMCWGGVNDWLNSAHIKSEPSQGSGDDTGANSAEFRCSQSGMLLAAPGGGQWGSWREWKTCPVGSAICGITSRFEEWSKNQDDTGMNGMNLHCCSL